MVYEESDPGFFVDIDKTESGRFVVISAHDHTTSEVRLVEASAPESAPRLVAARERGIEYDLSHHGELLYILTNADAATDFKIVTAPVEAEGREGWRDWLPHEAGTYVCAQLLFAGHHVRLERVGGLPRIVVTDLESGEAHTIAFEEEAYDLSLSARIRIRDPDAPLRLQLDDDAAADLRLRHARPYPDAAQDPGGAERARSRRLRHPPADRREP